MFWHVSQERRYAWWENKYARIKPFSPWSLDRELGRDNTESACIDGTPAREKYDAHFQHPPASAWKKRLIIYIVFTTFITVVAAVTAAVGFQYGRRQCRLDPKLETSSQETNPTRHCGNSTREALAIGCTFNQLAWSWFPPGCPQYANDEFMAAENWTYYLDNQKEQVATGEKWLAALDNKVELWGESREHTAHCLYVFLSLAQIIRDRTPYATYFRNYGHMVHCAGVIMDVLRKEPDRDRIATFVGKVSYDQQCF